MLWPRETSVFELLCLREPYPGIRTMCVLAEPVRYVELLRKWSTMCDHLVWSWSLNLVICLQRATKRHSCQACPSWKAQVPGEPMASSTTRLEAWDPGLFLRQDDMGVPVQQDNEICSPFVLYRPSGHGPLGHGMTSVFCPPSQTWYCSAIYVFLNSVRVASKMNHNTSQINSCLLGSIGVLYLKHQT